MALVLQDRVRETTITTGTGTLTLAGAVTGFQSFSVIGNGNTTYYAITDGTNWEVGIGTYTASGTTLSRDTVIASSNSGNKVSWSAGSKDVFVTLPASKSRTTTSDTAPSNPTNGDNWYNTTDGVTYVYYNDGTSSQWVDTTPYMNTPNIGADLFGGFSFTNTWDWEIDGGGAPYSNYPFGVDVDGGYGSDVTTPYIAITGGSASTAYDIYGEAIDGGVASS